MVDTLRPSPEGPSETPAGEGRSLGGKYVLRALLGHGGYGAVYDAEHQWTRRRVAVKVLLPAVAHRAEVVARFVQEARAATAIAHPNIVEVLDFDVQSDGTAFLVMERLEGESLAARLAREGALSVDETLGLLDPVLDALEAAHARGILHRDLKPENVFLARDERGEIAPKLLDFGVAKVLHGMALATTRSGVLLGTPLYMAPEQGRSDRAPDARVDVWSAGCVLYECLCGAPPYDARSVEELFVRRATQPPPPLRSRCPAVPEAVASVVHQALERDPERRLPTVAALREGLRRAHGPLRPDELPAREPSTPPCERDPRASEPPRSAGPHGAAVAFAAFALLTHAWGERASRPPPLPADPIPTRAEVTAEAPLLRPVVERSYARPAPLSRRSSRVTRLALR